MGVKEPIPNLPLWLLDTLDMLLPDEVTNILTMMKNYWETGEEGKPIGNDRYPWPAVRLWLDVEKKKTEPRAVRNSPQYREWRTKVFMRDGFKCQICGKVGEAINAHHIKRFSDYPEERFNVDNGITLCADCHHAVHRHEIEIERRG